MPVASIRTNNPGAMWPGPSAQRFGATGWQTLADGNKIAIFDDPVKGAAAQFDLLGRKYVNMPLVDVVRKWSGGNSSAAYTQHLIGKLGVPADTMVTPDLLRDPGFAIPFAKAAAHWEAGQDYPMTDHQWSQAFSMATGAAPYTPTPGAAPMVEKFGGAANTKGQRTGMSPTPLDSSVIDAQGLGIKQNRSKLLAAMLDKIAYNPDTPKSGLEGFSKVVAALVGGYKGKQSDEFEMQKRQAMLSLLGGQQLSPMAQYALASGDPDMEKVAVASEFKNKSDLDQKSLRINDLIQQGITPADAHAIVSGAVTSDNNGNFTDYRTGIRTMADGRRVRIMPGSDQGQQPAAQGGGAAPAMTPMPNVPGVSVAGGPGSATAGAPPIQNSQGLPSVATPDEGKPSITLDGSTKNGVIDPLNGGMAPPKAVTDEVSKEMVGQVQLDAALQDLAKNIDPSLLGNVGRIKTWGQRQANNWGMDPGWVDPYQAKDQAMKVDQLFNTYRKYVTGAAAAEKELADLRQAFLNNDMNPQETFQAIATLQSIGRRNYAINQALVQNGFTPGSKEYGEEFDRRRAAMGTEDTTAAGKRMLAEAETRWQGIHKQRAAEERAARRPRGAANATPAPAAPVSWPTPPPEALEQLRTADTPETRAHFDEVFGPGAAAKAMGAQ